MFIPEKLYLLPIGLAFGLIAGISFSYWLVHGYLPRHGWTEMWALQRKVLLVLAVLIALISLARVALFLLGYKDLAAVL